MCGFGLVVIVIALRRGCGLARDYVSSYAIILGKSRGNSQSPLNTSKQPRRLITIIDSRVSDTLEIMKSTDRI